MAITHYHNEHENQKQTGEQAMIEIRNRYSGVVIKTVDAADLRGANLRGANLTDADLTVAHLRGANLAGATLTGTCLDSDSTPNADVFGFGRCGRFVAAYRTRKAGHIDRYRDGRTYTADWFSTADTECHPGLYIWPTLEMARQWSGGELIRVYALPEDVHRAGKKWRCRMFRVIGAMDA